MSKVTAPISYDEVTTTVKHRWQAVHEAHAVYRPRSPEKTPFYQVFSQHFDRYTQVYEERFGRNSGFLRSAVAKSVEEFLDCGLLHGGFARIRCPSCHSEHLLAFSCQTRNFCPSCQAKRGALFAEKLSEEILTDVPHRYIIFTIPKALRVLFERERGLLSILSKSAYDATAMTVAQILGDKDARCGFVASIQTFGSYAANFHPHIHAIVTEGCFSSDGAFKRLEEFPTDLIEKAFRRLVLLRLHRAKRLSESFMQSLFTWVHSGFSVHAKHQIEAQDKVGMAKLARYATRAPISLKSITIQEDGQVLVKTPRNHQTGASFLVLDPLEFIHHVVSQIPNPGMHMVRYYGAYSNRGRRRFSESLLVGKSRGDESEEYDETRCGTTKSRASWARLMKKIFEVDPLLCPQCKITMKIVAIISKPAVIDRIIKHRRDAHLEDPFESQAPP